MNNSAGKHLILDGTTASPDVFTALTIETLFSKVIEALEMKALGPVVTYEVPVDLEVQRRVEKTGKFEDSGGITSFVVISTSHLALHSWPLERRFSADVFSCKDFDHEKALHLFREILGVDRLQVTVMDRQKA